MDQAKTTVPVLPIRNTVLFPAVAVPLVIGRAKSIRAVEKAQSVDNLIVAVAQRTMTSGDPGSNDLYRVGTLCKIENLITTDTGVKQLFVTGVARYQVSSFSEGSEGYLFARGEVILDTPGENPIRAEALFNHLKDLSREIIELLPGTNVPIMQLVERIDDPSYLCNICSAYLNLSMSQKQDLLETVQLERRMELLLDIMQKEKEVLSIQQDIRNKMSERMGKAQRDAFLREQLRTIQSELGEENDQNIVSELEEKIRKAKLPEEPGKIAAEELNRLRDLPTASAEYHVIRTYLEWLSVLPWAKKTETQIDIPLARKILDQDHYGLETVKRRILQFLAVAKLKNDIHGPILCLVGPPGVGKTSLGNSIANALGRKFIRTSLGGVRDEAEIRGHRRTYVGAMPGRIMQSIKRVGTRNPLMMLDEIDKLHADFHGDPSAAMLEVLDPEQNCTFTDHYLDVPFDLSDVFFIATANIIDTIPSALLDRMEVIDVNGYTLVEKRHIARRHLLPKLLLDHGINENWILLPDETIETIIMQYTREAGVRELERKLAALLRSAAEEVVRFSPNIMPNMPQTLPPISLIPARLKELIGPRRFFQEIMDRGLRAGVVTGLAWTPHGGDLLYIEASAVTGGKGQITLTGQLGDVMKESAQIALSLARNKAANFDFNKHDIHVHVPSGAIPKDGPSAGVTILTALVSLLLGIPVQAGLAMTGEITLRGAVLPVGGIKEKILAAHRAGLKTVIIPKYNSEDLTDVPEDVRTDLKFIFVENIEETLDYALGLGKPSVAHNHLRAV